MNDYPTLKELGIHATATIKRFSLRRESDRDVLKIHFYRPAKALRSPSQKFTFAHPRKAIPGQSRLSQAFAELAPSSPVLRSALVELKQLTAQQRSAPQAEPLAVVNPAAPNRLAEARPAAECLG